MKTYTTTAREPSIYITCHVLSTLTLIQLNLQCTLLVIASKTYSVFRERKREKEREREKERVSSLSKIVGLAFYYREKVDKRDAKNFTASYFLIIGLRKFQSFSKGLSNFYLFERVPRAKELEEINNSTFKTIQGLYNIFTIAEK